MQRSCGRSKASCTGETGRLQWGHREVMKVKMVRSHGPPGVREPAAESAHVRSPLSPWGDPMREELQDREGQW